MSEHDVDAFGPVDYLVVEFPEGKSQFHGEMAAALHDLVERGLIRILDLVIIEKDADGSFEAFEVPDRDDSEVGALRAFETEVTELLAADDIAALAGAMEPGSIAAVLAWENAWAVPFASAVRRAGGRLAATGRIPMQAIMSLIEQGEGSTSEGV